MQKTKIDYAIFEASERDKPHNKKLIRSYLYDDCRFLHDYVSAFIDRHGLHLTQAGCAMKTWQKMTGNVAPRDDGTIYDYFKKFYYGGRCQAFKTGLIDYSTAMVDINSAYPFSMLSRHPIGLYYEILDPGDVGEITGDMFITVSAISRGAYPFRSDDGGLFFPDDGIERLFYVTGWEYLAAGDTVGHGGSDIITIYHFPESLDFSDYILPLYNERLAAKNNGDKKSDILCKLLMNSLYGKFASNPDDYKKFRAADPAKLAEYKRGQDIDSAPDWSFGGFFGDVALLVKPLPDNEKRYYNVATAASITGFVRAYLWRAICRCGDVLYCDTDSIIARDVSALSTGENLGEWKIEAAFESGGIGGKKIYAFRDFFGKWKSACKGARLPESDILRIANGEPVLYEPIAPTFSVHKNPSFVNRTIQKTDKKLSEKNSVKSIVKPIRIF